MTSELSYSSIKVAHSVREFEEKRSQERKKNLLVLIRQYLREEGYNESARKFESEAKIPTSLTICDNVDLPTILQEYESYFFLRFQKYPKICKKDQTPVAGNKKELKKCAGDPEATENSEKEKPKQPTKFVLKNNDRSQSLNKLKTETVANLDLTVYPLAICPNQNMLAISQSQVDFPKYKLLKPFSSYDGYNEDWKSFADIIAKEIIIDYPNVKWEDIIGLDTAKRLLKESVVYPTKYPELFNGILTPWKGLLLFGPPGTGKTLLAKAVATECNTTFFNISASTIVSKWRGDSEKLVRVMFEMARHQAPSTIFVDEIDSLASRRDLTTEHEASRRLKSELLVQLDGLAHSNDKVFLLTTSNLPWELDPAILRRLEKRILVDVPSLEARRAMFQYHLPKKIVEKPSMTSSIDYDAVAEETEGYSGSDIKLVCKEVAMQAMRQIFDALEETKSGKELQALNLKTVTTEDVLQALSKTKPIGASMLKRFRKWQVEFEST